VVEVSAARFHGAGADELIFHPAVLGTPPMLREVEVTVVPGGLREATGAEIDPAATTLDIHGSVIIIRIMMTREMILKRTSPLLYKPFFVVLTI
jgi:hypothetical protein